MYYNGSKVFLISFFVSLITAVVISVLAFFFLPKFVSARDVVVPNLIGTTADEARFLCESRGLLFIVSGEEESAKVAEGRIARQTPFPGSVVRSKSTITAKISKGSMQVVVPDLKNQTLVTATTKLSQLNLVIGEVRPVENDEVQANHVVKTIPSAGSKVKKETSIVLFVSKGAQEVTVPRVIGRSLSRAKNIIVGSGLKVGNVRYQVSTEFNVGIIMSQSPRPNQKAKKGSKVNLVVATVLE